MKKTNKFHIDWLDVLVNITHDPKKVSNGLTLYLNESLDYDQAQYSYRPKIIESDNNHKLEVKSVNRKLKISGNFYKWLNGQNIEGCDSVCSLVIEVLLKLEEMNLIQPTIDQYEIIRQGKFRIYKIHVKQDIVFNNKSLALNYLEQIKKGGYYPYRSKTIYQNGVYFGMKSKRWVLNFYHKGKEIEQAKNNKCIVTSEQKAFADMVIRSEIKINPPQLTDWDLRFAWQWFDIDNLDKFFKQRLSELQLPDFNRVIELDKITNNADKKFYYSLKNGNEEIFYCRSSIHRMRKKFMKEYNIDIDSIYNNQLGNNV
ncbi:phage/plasmid replication protein, II/X family [Acinetobacter sp. NIPH 1869]|uniref:phage/plasmid replication protein, II/X family n=1 Tax=Acinetobacter higginsii TaxID=70347 RepID=UPI001F4A70EF|nr:phage/plasmid replication protein, II/X family [Acinetobacter higginsii]MCH7303514.1 phage/plasmid replication protein, II/X family [Acinetobacter higginsii]